MPAPVITNHAGPRIGDNSFGNASIGINDQRVANTLVRKWPVSQSTPNVEIVSDGSANADVNVTFGSLTLSSSGTVIVNGNFSRTLGSIALSSSAADVINGDLARTLGSLSLSSAAADIVSGSLARTLGSLTLSSSGTVIVSGTFARTLGSLVLDSSATTGVDINGSLSRTLGSIVLSSTGTRSTGPEGGISGYLEEERKRYERHRGKVHRMNAALMPRSMAESTRRGEELIALARDEEDIALLLLAVSEHYYA